jgi:surfeit locus 1 family protein
MISRRWWWTTILVILACGVMVRLGIWQLDRLEARKAFNARVQAQLDQPPLLLNGSGLQADLVDMEYRSVTVVGEFDHTEEVALRNRAWGGQPGVNLITPLRIAGSDMAVLVDRGWIPAEDTAQENWAQYIQGGVVEVKGMIRRSSVRPDLGRRADPTPMPGQNGLSHWNLLNVERIGNQVSAPLLPVYIHWSPDESYTGLPYRDEIELDLTEGSHLGYAGQWFLFASILAFGYPAFLHRQNPAPASLSETAGNEKKTIGVSG